MFRVFARRGGIRSWRRARPTALRRRGRRTAPKSKEARARHGGMRGGITHDGQDVQPTGGDDVGDVGENGVTHDFLHCRDRRAQNEREPNKTGNEAGKVIAPSDRPPRRRLARTPPGPGTRLHAIILPGGRDAKRIKVAPTTVPQDAPIRYAIRRKVRAIGENFSASPKPPREPDAAKQLSIRTCRLIKPPRRLFQQAIRASIAPSYRSPA